MLPVAILAGGLAQRLRPVTSTIPKILIDINGRPFGEHQLDWLQSQGVTRVVYCLGYLGDQVVAALGDGSRWGMRFDFVMDGPKLLGTGGALRQALPQLGATFFVLYGDSLLTCNLAEVERAYRERGRPSLMTVYPNANQWDTSNVLFRDDEIVVYDKKQRLPEMRHIDYGLGVLTADTLERYQPDTILDLETVYQDELRLGRLTGVEVATRFYEIGSVAGIEETRRYLAERSS